MLYFVVRVGESLVESVIPRTSAEELNLKNGDSGRVVVESTEVCVQNDCAASRAFYRSSTRAQPPARPAAVRRGLGRIEIGLSVVSPAGRFC